MFVRPLPLPDRPVRCSRWNPVHVDFRFDTQDRLVLGLTVVRHLDLKSVGFVPAVMAVTVWRCPCINEDVTVMDGVFAHRWPACDFVVRTSSGLHGNRIDTTKQGCY